MYYVSVQNEKISALGFGTMRLPTLQDGHVDQEKVNQMVDIAIQGGVNYFDSAYAYINGESEVAIGKALSRYPRDSYYLATKYPGHQMVPCYNPSEIFEDQLKKCGVDYFDFYLLHNVYENSIDVYRDPKWNIIPYFLEQKKMGRIRHLGFSSHARIDCLKTFIEEYGKDMEFILMETNYLDWSLQKVKEKYEYLESVQMPIFVMEPLRGGRLAQLPEDQNKKLDMLPDKESAVSYAFRFLQSLPNVKVVLSGMSSPEQMIDNIRIFDRRRELGEEEKNCLFSIAETLKNSLPCTSCRYCVNGCPMGLDIPRLIDLCNEYRYGIRGSLVVSMALEAIPEDKQHTACIGCGACAAVCPQRIDIPGELKKFAEQIPQMPNWKKICEERAARAAEMKKGKE